MLINFIIASGGQLIFLKLVDGSNQVKNAENLCDMLDEVVIEVGVANVIQIMTDNAIVYMAAGRLLMERHPTLFWSPCVAHSLDLLFEDLGKLSWVEKVVEDGRNIAKYIYNHTWVLSLMREHTSGKDLVWAGVTRFATNFLNVQSISETLLNLRRMFLDKKWLESPYDRKPEAKKIMRIVFDVSFEKLMEETLKVSFQVFIDDLVFIFEIFFLADFCMFYYVQVSEPLVKVLRIVDGDINPMGFLYEAMDRAKEAIQHLYGSNETKYRPVWNIIDRRWN